MITMAKNGNSSLKDAKKIYRKIPRGLTTLLMTDNEYIAASVAGYKNDVKKAKSRLKKSRTNLLKYIIEAISSSNKLSNKEKNSLKFYANKNKIIIISILLIVLLLSIFAT